jgi:hypothetical protein
MIDDYEYRIVTFIDILGFKKIVMDSEKDINLRNLISNALRYFKKWESSERWGLKFIEIEEDAQKKTIENFQIDTQTVCTCFSDSIVISVKVTEGKLNETFSTLIANIADMGNFLLRKGILIRGGITVGNLYHDENGVVYGSALIESYNLESTTAIYPRIILSKRLIDSLNYPLVRKADRYPYHQYISRFNDGCVGFHQMTVLQVAQNSSVITQEALKKRLRESKSTIIKGLDDNFDNPNVFKKFQWLRDEYNKLIILDNCYEKIYDTEIADPRHNIHYSYINELRSKN